MIIWAEIWCWTWSECGCGRVVYCHECKCWLVPRSDLADHLTLLTRRAVCQWVSSWNLFGMIVKHGHLKTYIESVQAKVMYPCNLWFLRIYIESVHEKFKYTCNQCDYIATTQNNLMLGSWWPHLIWIFKFVFVMNSHYNYCNPRLTSPDTLTQHSRPCVAMMRGDMIRQVRPEHQSVNTFVADKNSRLDIHQLFT